LSNGAADWGGCEYVQSCSVQTHGKEPIMAEEFEEEEVQEETKLPHWAHLAFAIGLRGF